MTREVDSSRTADASAIPIASTLKCGEIHQMSAESHAISECLGELQQVVAEQHDVSALAGDIGPEPSQSDGSPRQRGRIVDAVTTIATTRPFATRF